MMCYCLVTVPMSQQLCSSFFISEPTGSCVWISFVLLSCLCTLACSCGTPVLLSASAIRQCRLPMEFHTEEGSPVRRGTPACVHRPFCTPMTRVSVLCAFPTRGVDHVAEAELLECTSCTQGVLCRWGLVLPYNGAARICNTLSTLTLNINKQTVPMVSVCRHSW